MPCRLSGGGGLNLPCDFGYCGPDLSEAYLNDGLYMNSDGLWTFLQNVWGWPIFAANNGQQQPQSPQQPPNRCGNSTTSPPASDIENLVTTFSGLMRPLNYAFVNASMFASSAALFAAGGLAISGGCLEPTPAEPATCAAGIFGGVHAFAGGAVSGTAAILFFKNYTLPAFKKWGC
jgi:hypothetical protein